MKVEGDMLENMRPKRPTLFIPLRADRRTQNLLFHVSIEQEPKFLLLDLEGKDAVCLLGSGQSQQILLLGRGGWREGEMEQKQQK